MPLTEALPDDELAETELPDTEADEEDEVEYVVTLPQPTFPETLLSASEAEVALAIDKLEKLDRKVMSSSEKAPEPVRVLASQARPRYVWQLSRLEEVAPKRWPLKSDVTTVSTSLKTQPSNKPWPSESPSMACPLLSSQTLFTAWKSVEPESAGLRPEVW